MLKFGISAVLLAAAAPLIAQPAAQPATPPATAQQQQPQQPQPPAEFIQAAQGFGQCIQAGATQLPATVTPEAGATQLLAGCAQQKAALETQFDAWISGPNFPEAGREIARQQFRAQLGQAEVQIAQMIRQSRSGAQPAN